MKKLECQSVLHPHCYGCGPINIRYIFISFFRNNKIYTKTDRLPQLRMASYAFVTMFGIDLSHSVSAFGDDIDLRGGSRIQKGGGFVH